MEELPEWEFGTAGVLCVAGPHPIPISTALRAGPLRVLFILGGRRATLARLRHDPAAALCLMGEGLAFTAHGRAHPRDERLESAPKVVVVELAVSRVQDHLADGRTEMLAAADWCWVDEDAARADEGIRDELAQLASGSR
jgi:hypothetical protein